MAKLLPYEKYVVESPLSANQIIIKLLEKTLSQEEYISESDKRVFSFGLKRWSKPYWGYIRNDSFELERLIDYRNFGNPKILGFIKQNGNSTHVKIIMRPKGFWLGFICLSLAGILYGLVVSIIQSINFNELQDGVVVAGGLFVFTFMIFLVSFKAEAVKSRKALKDLLEKVEHPNKTAANIGLPKAW